MLKNDGLNEHLFKAVATIGRGGKADEIRRALNEEHSCFAHYTSMSALFEIAESRQFLMRNTRLMNDKSEVSHGFDTILRCLRAGRGGQRYIEAWNALLGDRSFDLAKHVSELRPSIERNCYVLSVCQHHALEDRDGKLSMWRAYGAGELRGAIVFNRNFLKALDGMNLLATPVFYGSDSDEEVDVELEIRAHLIHDHAEALSKLASNLLCDLAVALTINFAVSIKHVGFREEREWRLMYVRHVTRPQMEQEKKLMVVGGVPQAVFPFKFLWPTDKGFDLQSLFFSHVIIGPWSEQNTIKAAVEEMLVSYGVDDAASRVVLSTIPYRQKL